MSWIIWSAARLSSAVVKPIFMGEASSSRSALIAALQTVALSSRLTHSPGVFTQQPKQPEQPFKSRPARSSFVVSWPMATSRHFSSQRYASNADVESGSPFRMTMLIEELLSLLKLMFLLCRNCCTKQFYDVEYFCQAPDEDFF